MRKVITILLEIFFPSRCFICNKEDEPVCETCLDQLAYCYTTPFPYIKSCYSFRDHNLKKVIHAIKYKHRKDLIPPLTKRLYVLNKEIFTDVESTVLTPIPMYPLRKLLRGYNHSELLAETLSQLTGIPVCHALIRSKYRRRQALQTSKQNRLKNQRNSMRLSMPIPSYIKHIILIDDVTTTGATLEEARRALNQEPAITITALTIAH